MIISSNIYTFSVSEENKARPVLFVMVGLPGSGKSFIAGNFKIAREDAISKPIIHSSDELRAELYGNAEDNLHNKELFEELHKRIKADLSSGHDVIYDATNINKKRRTAFLNELKNISCTKVCVIVMTPYETCLKWNSQRERKVPENVIKRMYMSWQPPSWSEGFDHILVYDNYENETSRKEAEDYDILFNGEYGLNNIDQENEHHHYTIGKHCQRVYEYLVRYYDDPILQLAGLYHDVGKGFAKTRVNAHGIEDGNCHYYGHESVSAYMAMFLLNDILKGENNYTRIWIKVMVSNLIFYHMRPLTAWMRSEKARERDRSVMGDFLYKKLIALNEADIACQ